MLKRVYVTGAGIISCIGKNMGETLESLRTLASGVGPINYLSTVHKNTIPAGEVKFSDMELIEMAGVRGKKGLTRTSLLGMIAAGEALKNAGIQNIRDMRTGLVSANTVGGMGKTELYYKDYISAEKTNENFEFIRGHDCGDSTEKIADHLRIDEYITTINTACSSSANAIMFGARLIKNNLVDRVVAGGTDSLTKFTLNGFNSLMILDKDTCKPFDEKRVGLNLGEGAGYLVLESEESVRSRDAKPLSELKGYGNTCDAYHQTASSPDGNGAMLAMKKALETAGFKPGDIDYINLHGTATIMNDLSEGKAVEAVFSDKVPRASSTKGYTGHTLGASGGIEAVFSNLAIWHNISLPNLNFTEQIKDLHFNPNAAFNENAGINNVLSNSFGFGGNNTALIFSRC